MPARLVVAYAEMPATELLRREAALLHGIAPERVVLGHRCARCGSDEHGRPLLVPTAALREPVHVSIARAGPLSVVALTDLGPVGVDVEPEGAAAFDGFDEVARHPAERGAPDRTGSWVRTEALLKAYGLGLAVDPSEVSVDEHGAIAWSSSFPPPPRAIVRDIEVPGHRASVVVLVDDPASAADLELVVRRG